MVTASNTLVLRGALLSVALAAVVSAACGKLVGIGDTNVAEPQGGAGDGDGSGGSSGSAVGGKGGAAGMSAGGRASQAGTTSAGGSTAGGASGGSSGQGGSAAGTGGSSAGTGGAGGSTAGTGAGGKGGGGKGDGSAGVGTGGGTGGSTAGTGEGGVPGTDCTDGDERCVSGAHETCTGGAYAPDACPLNKPTCEAATGACIVRGPTMVKATDFYIDSTEVTVAQYTEFTDAKGTDTSGQPGVCAWNDTYAPADITGADNTPITDVDWCDANAYCKWADKHLCGRIDGGKLTRAEVFDSTISQWYLACGGGGYHPNGDWDCNERNGAANPGPVGSFPGCEGYPSGLFDMEGNVAEWVDVCDSTNGATDTCYPLGGSVNDAKGNAFCDEEYDGYTRDHTYWAVGFRCCSG